MSKTKKASGKQKTPSASETSASIATQIEAFLKSGQEIQHIPNGISGVTSTAGPKHITLGKKTG